MLGPADALNIIIQMSRTQKSLLVAASVIAVLAAGILIGRYTGPDDSPGAVGSPTATTGKKPAKSGGKAKGGDPVLDFVSKPPSGVVRFAAKARSVYSSAAEAEVSAARFTGDLDITIFSDSFTDGSGKKRGPGTISISGAAASFKALEIDVKAAGMTIKPTYALIDSLALLWNGPLKVSGTRFTFRGTAPDAQEKKIAGPITTAAGRGSADAAGSTSVRWTNPPESLDIVQPERSNFSWAGSGSIHVDERVIKATYGGAMGTNLDATVRRSGKHLKVTGDVVYTQVFAEGKPIFRTKGTVQVKVKPPATARGERGWFTWAPTNATTIDLCITKIEARNAAGRWVNMNLQTLDPMFGGENHKGIGGDTRTLDGTDGGSFFSGASPISSVIQAKTGDERRISFDVPAGVRQGTHTITLRLSGNFPAISVKVPVKVTF